MSTTIELEKSEQTTLANQVNENETLTEAEIVSSTANITITTEDLQMSANTENNEVELSEITAETVETVITTTNNAVEVTIVESTEENGLEKGKSLAIVNPAANALIAANNQSIKYARGNTLMSQIGTYIGFEEAERITNALLLSGKLDAWMKVERVDGGENYVGRLVLDNTSTIIIDPIEPEDATGVLSHNNYFDAVYKTDARGGEEYPVIFDVQAIISIVNRVSSLAINKTIFLLSLAQNIAISGLSSSDISLVIEKLITESYMPGFNNFRDTIKKAKWGYKRFNGVMSEQEAESLYLMRDYAILDDKGIIKFVDTAADSYTTYTKANLVLMFENKKIEVINENTGNVKMVNPVGIYLESRHRKEYKGVAFDPSNKLDPSIYNLFNGFKYGSGKSTICIQKFKDYVREVICSANNQRYMIIWSFFAQMLQNPFQKMGTAIIMMSIEGSGKGTLMRVIGELMDKYYMASTDHKRITSPFNKHLETVLLYYANEANFTDSSLTANKLKNIITETDATSEIKGGDTYATRNYTHLVIDSNDNAPVQKNADSRRFISLEVSSVRVGDIAYWDELNALIETDGFYESVMYDLMNFDYSEWADFLRVPPVEEISPEQIQASFSAVEAWWQYCLENARIPFVQYDLTDEDKLNIPNESMFHSFKKWCTLNGHKHSLDSSTFGTTFRTQAIGRDSGLDKKGKVSIAGERKHSHVYETLDKCRESFAKIKQLNNIDFIGNEWKLPIVS